MTTSISRIFYSFWFFGGFSSIWPNCASLFCVLYEHALWVGTGITILLWVVVLVVVVPLGATDLSSVCRVCRSAPHTPPPPACPPEAVLSSKRPKLAPQNKFTHCGFTKFFKFNSQQIDIFSVSGDWMRGPPEAVLSSKKAKVGSIVEIQLRPPHHRVKVTLFD